jgi:hypothetical protein
MPDQKLFHLCRQISTQKDPQELTQLIDDLIKLLSEEQDTIKAKIRANIGRSDIIPE